MASLSRRVVKEDKMLVNKSPHDLMEGVQWNDFFQVADTSRLRGHYLKLKKRIGLDLCQFAFSQSVVIMWRSLSAELITA